LSQIGKTAQAQVASDIDSINPEIVQEEAVAESDRSVPPEEDATLITQLPQVRTPDLVLDALPSPTHDVEAVLSVKEPCKEIESEIQSDSVSFLRGSYSTSFWNKPLVRSALVLFGAMLMFGLFAQWLYFERSRLSAADPQLMPLLRSLCLQLNCSVPAWQQIESMQIDSAAFSKISKDGFRLKFSIKNGASTDLAVPDIELTLTDSADQPISRRILTAVELGSVSPTLQAGAEWRASVVLRVKTEALSPAVVGYRLVAFYP
jgi:hypothetical protein